MATRACPEECTRAGRYTCSETLSEGEMEEERERIAQDSKLHALTTTIELSTHRFLEGVDQ